MSMYKVFKLEPQEIRLFQVQNDKLWHMELKDHANFLQFFTMQIHSKATTFMHEETNTRGVRSFRCRRPHSDN